MQYRAGQTFYAKHDNKPLVVTIVATKGELFGVLAGWRIRRLTPLECWRLQGFPDWAFDRARAAGVSDSQLYKQAGNSVTVNVIKAIGERL